MSAGTKFSFGARGQQRSRNLGDFEGLINLLPVSVLLIDQEHNTILAANPSALDLTGYTSREIIGMELTSLLPDVQNTLYATLSNNIKVDTPHPTRLIQRNLVTKNVAVTIRLINPAQKLGVILIESDQHNNSISNTGNKDNIWKQLTKLFTEITTTQQFITKITRVLEFGEEISQAEILAIYTTSPVEIGYNRVAGIGDFAWMPEKILSQDLSTPNAKNIWLPGKRSTSIFHRLALNQGIHYLTIARIGSSNATIGLLVIASKNDDLHPYLPQISELLAAAAADVIGQAVMDSSNRDLSDQIAAITARNQITQEHLAEGLITLDAELRIDVLNQAAEKILGYTSKETNRQPIANILVGAETLLDALAAAPAGQVEIFNDSLRIYRRRGESFLARLKAFSTTLGGKLSGFILLIQDLTELEQIWEQTRQLEQRAILGEITAVFAHEVRNPINNISTGLELMQLRMLPDDPNRPAIDRLMSDCDRLTELMKSVLAYAKPTEYAMGRIPLAPYLKSIIDRLRLRFERNNVTCRLEIDPECPAIYGNPGAIEQVLVNLINNSINAMADQDGQLTVRAHKLVDNSLLHQLNAHPYVEINIIDSGPGIPTEQQERIFTPFFTTNEGGTGLGLAIAKRIITAHKGLITLTSFPGATMFRILLPAFETNE
jgi:PAS domain S-box-containing protein